ncbi:MAG TPA: 50S ribosomal protein L11 methyltransferase [Stellaceae bacterium]|nr:50S ribosomal protein L11 methyltransferase [Stellaceae bacterium]
MKKPETRLRGAMSGLWRVMLRAPNADGAAAASDALGELAAVSIFEENPGGSWRIEGLATAPPDRPRIAARLALAWLRLGGVAPELDWERLPPTDWLALNQASFPPITAGRYFVHGSLHRRPAPPGRIGLLIDAATAFGTGEHATTRGCLLTLDAVARMGSPRRVLDMGTGTGVLAFAAAKTWHRPVRAFDIDPEAVRVAAHNARRNGVARVVRVRRSMGYRDRAAARGGDYELVLANILARPLMLMARDLAHALAPSGIAVLSGLLPEQEQAVLAAHRLMRLRLRGRLVIDGWSTLVLSRGRPTIFRSLRKHLIR